MKATAAMMVLSMLAVAAALTASLLPLILKNLKKVLLLAAGGAAVAAGKVSFCKTQIDKKPYIIDSGITTRQHDIKIYFAKHLVRGGTWGRSCKDSLNIYPTRLFFKEIKQNSGFAIFVHKV